MIRITRKGQSAISKPRRQTIVTLTALCLGLSIVAGCNTTRNAPVSATHATKPLQPGTPELQKALSYWGNSYERNPTDKSASMNYAAALRINNQGTQAEAVLRKSVIAHQGDPEIAAAYGKVLAENGKLQEALGVLDTAIDPANPDWRMLSAKGAIHDQLGQPEQARKLYTQALQIAPNEPSILNNLGMSYILTEELPKAEQALRLALEKPGATSRVRQNLALAMGLQGKFDQAIAVAEAELDPAQAQANIAYLQAMLQKRLQKQQAG
ncbi:tetratricopeptide repeat protein [Pseudovibrio exalbescens]|uniref:tetratricopeptide repeat protein n=1 Tax=Pseudovibrio exalbescens TaxID=197461 RepID=UPI000C999B10|nr:tetratricopeptide repeat protein [Pseudovibrio exalbescens]